MSTPSNGVDVPAVPVKTAARASIALAVLVAIAPPILGQAAAGGYEEEPKPQPVASGLPEDLSQPPDGNWLVDEDGLEYFTFELPKEGLRYARVNPGTIRIARGPYLRLANESETHFRIKIVNNKSIPIPPPPSGPTDLERAVVEASYQPNVEEVDRLGFEGFGRGLPREGLWRNGFDLADFNGDGHLDLVHGPPRKSGAGPVIFLGDGAGSWSLWETATYPPAPYDYGDAVAGDWNGDGKTDLALGVHGRGAIALIGDGKGGFALWNEGLELEQPGHSGRPAFSSRSLTSTDWDKDGRPDLIVLSEGPRGFDHVGKHGANGIMFYRNRGDGTWGKRADTVSRVFGDKIVTADTDGDGHPEIVTSTNYASERSLVNRWLGEGWEWQRENIDGLRPLALVWSVAAGDFDGDGRDDVVAAHRSRELGEGRSGIDIFFSREDGSWERMPLFFRGAEAGLLDIHALAVGHADTDRHLDIAATTSDGRLFLFLGDGEGGFVREVEETMEKPLSGCRGYDLEIIDLDGRAGGEIVATFAGESCPNQGSILAWKVVPKAATDEGEAQVEGKGAATP